MINKIIRNFLAKQVAGRSDDGIMITLKDPKKVEMLENIMADLLMRNGIDPKAITSEAQLKGILNQIEAMTKQSTTSGIRNVESAKVFDLEGKQIPPGSKIMGGKAIDDLPPPGSRGGPDDIAAPVQSSEETLKNMIEAENKKGIAKIKQRQKMLDDAIEDASPGFANDIKYDAEIVAENLAERMGLVYDDLPTKQRLDLYDKAYTGLSKKRFKQRESLEDFVDDAGGVDESDPRGIDDFIPDPEDMAKGGRVGFFKGAVAGGGNISPGTDTKGNVRDDNPFTGGGGGNNNNQPPPKKTLTTTQTKDDTKKNVLKTVGSFAFNRFLNSMGVPTKDIQKALAIKGILEQAGDIMFPEGNLQNIKATSPDQRTYNIEATKDMVENLPGGLVKDIVAPAGALVMSPVYDTFQGIQRGLEDPNKSVLQAIKDENILSSAVERFTGAAAPLAERFEEGGIARIGLKDGMNRRTFLKLFSGLVSLPIIGKVLKPLKVGKTVTKVPIIKTDNVAGKPEWFDQLVNKVILEGDDVTKKFATKDREIVHIKKLDEDTNIMVTQDLDEGVVRVDYESPESMYGDPVGLQYKKPLPDEGDPRPGAEFDTTESIPVARADGPDDYAIEIDEGGGQSISDLVSDVSKLKQYATGQKPTLKEFVQSKKRKDQAKKISEGDREAETDFVINRQGEPIIDMEPDIDDVFATGGLARLKYQMGGDVAYDATNQDIYGSSAATFTPDTVMDQFGNQVQAEKGNNFNKPLIPQVTEQASKQEGIMNSSPVVSQSDGTGEIDMPIAGGNNNAGGILPVMPGDPPPAGILPVMPDKPAQPTMSDEDIMKGFEEFKKQNPDIMSGPATQAIVNLTLPGGTPISFRSGAGAYALRQYLKSIGMEAGPGKELFEPLKTAGPASRVDLNAVSPLAKTALANGGIARMLGE